MKRLILTSALLLAPSLALAQGLTVPVPNAGTTGTTLNSLAKLTGAPSTAVKTATTDTSGAEGVVINGAGTTGNALILKAGQSTCNFDAATTAGDWVQISSTIAGDCHDAGSTYPTSGQVVGRVLSTNGASGAYSMNVIANALPASGGGGGGGALTATTIATNTTAACGNAYFATAALTLTLPAANSQTSSCQISVKNVTANTGTTVVTLAVNAADNLNGGTTGAGTSLYSQQSSWYGTTAADHSWRDLGTQAACIAYTSSATVQITATRALYIAMMGQGGAGGNGFAQTVATTAGSGGGGGGAGQYLTQWFVGPDLAQLGTSVSLTFPAAATHGNAGGTLTFGSFLTANGGNFGADGASAASAVGGGSAGLNGTAGSSAGESSPNAVASGYWGLGTGGANSLSTGTGGVASSVQIGPYAAGGGSSGTGITTAEGQTIGASGRNQQFANGGTGGTVGGGTGGDAVGWNTLPYLPGAPGGAGGSSNSGNGGSAGHSGWGAGGSAGSACYNGGSACTAGLGANGGLPFTELCQW